MSVIDYKSLNIESVLEVVKRGTISIEKALELEKQGKNRVSLIDALNEMLDEQNNQETVTETYTLIGNIKYNEKRYVAGEKIELAPDEYEMFLNANVVQKAGG